MNNDFIDKLNNSMETMILANQKISNQSFLCYTKKEWDYIEANFEPFFPGVKRIILPNEFKGEFKLDDEIHTAIGKIPRTRTDNIGQNKDGN